MNTFILIPVFNEGEKFPALLKQIREYVNPSDLLVVDDGSTDNCCRGLEATGVNLIYHPVNQGKGAALQTGFGWAMEHGYEWVLTMDADGQHDPAYIPRFLEAAIESDAGIIAGSRRESMKSMPLDRRFSNLTTSWILSIVSGQKILDAQCGYRLYSTDFLRKITLRTTSFDTENELLLKAFKTNTKIAWIDMLKPFHVHHIHIRCLHLSLQDLYLFVKYIFRSGF